MHTLTRAAFGAALLLGTALPASGPALAIERGGEMVFARYADSLFLDPVLNDANLDIWILTNLYDTLLQPTLDGTGIQPGLATDWSLSDDGLAMTLTLRDGIKFTDGAPITVDDVAWSLNRARNPENGIWGFMLESIESIETTPPSTVTLKLSRPDPTLAAALATFNAGIMPQAPFEATPGATDQEKAEEFALHPVGSGPFMLTEWERGTAMTLARNPHYWELGEDGQPLPYLDSVRFEIIPDDATRILKLQAGEVDAGEFIPLSRVAELSADPNLDMQLFPSTKVVSVLMNNRPMLNDGTPNPLSDVRVRQALNYAIDKDAMIQVVTQGVGTPPRSYMASTTPLFVDFAPLYAYDLEKARGLLQEAGFGDGFALTSITTAGNADDAAKLAVLQQMWAPLNVTLTIEQMDQATLTARYRAADFQLRTASWTNDISDPSQITSYFAYSPTVQSMYTGYEDLELNALFEASQQELDPTVRAEQYRQIQETYLEAAPILFLYEQPYPVALRATVHDFVQIPLGNNIFVRAWKETAG